MSWFKRKEVIGEQTPQAEKFYDAERKERAVLSWILAFVSIAVVALLVIGLVVGGKWLYERASDNDKDEPTAVQEQASEDAHVPEQKTPAKKKTASKPKKTTESNTASNNSTLPSTGPAFDL